MKRILRYFIGNIKITIFILSIIILCSLSLVFVSYVLELILVAIASPVITFIVSTLFLIVGISVLLTLLDIFFNKGD